MSQEQRKAEATAALEAWRKILDAIPEGKFGPVAKHAETVELALRRGLAALQLLDSLRAYFLDETGEQSPFVKAIDKLISRE